MPSSSRVEGFRSSYAVLIGIDRYGDGVPVLRTPVADATKLAGILQQQHGFTADVICDENATLDKLRVLLGDLRTRVGKDDRVLFYFAGHGIALESDEGPRGFLLPQDSARDSADRYLPMVELNEALSALPCRHMLVILDCCFAGAFRWSSTRDLALTPDNLHRERYAWYVQDAARQAIASAAHDQKALDVAIGEALGKRGQTAGHSPFAKALIDGLAGAADLPRADGTGDGVITATELFLHLDEQLKPPPGSGRPRQTPILWPLPKHDKGQFVFLVPGKELDLPPAPSLDPEANPWRGLKPYESTHTDLFFGRRRASERLIEQVLRDPLVVVTGPSGIGKSSLVRAGLLPRLPASIHPIVVRPGPAPFASLAAALASEPPSGVSPDAEALRTDPNALATWVKDQHSAGRQILLVIDQAEELITMNRDEEVTQQYLAVMDKALDAEKRLRIVVTVRSDFEPQFAPSALKDRWLSSRYLVPQMTQDELRRVIEGPATVKVMRFESADLVDTLVNEVVQMPGALPLLSFALSEMYANYLRRQADDRTLTSKDYDALEGGVAGSLRVRANHLINELDDVHQSTVRRVLERLVSVESGEFARRRVPRRELKAADPDENSRVESILAHLDDARLIVTDEIENEPHLELAHDALILGWDRLLAWVREDLERIIALRRLTPDAEDWAATKNAGLLWDDAARVTIVKELQNAASPGLDAIEHQFTTASLKRSKRNQIIWWTTAAALVMLTAGAVWFAKISRDRLYDVERLSYFNRIELAERYRLDGQVTRANEILGDCLPSNECGWEWRYLKRVLHQELLSFTHEPRISLITFIIGSDKSVQLASVSQDTTMRIWNMRDGKEVRESQLSRSSVAAIAVSDKGRIVAADPGGTLLVIGRSEPENQILCENCRPNDPAIPGGTLAIAADGHRVAAIVGSVVKVWETDNGHEIPLGLPPARYKKAALFSDGSSLVTLTRSPHFADDGRIDTIEVWPLEPHQGNPRRFRDRDVNDFAINPAGTIVAVATELGPTLYDLQTGEMRRLSAGERAAKALSFAPDGQRLAVSGTDGSVTIWSIPHSRPLLSMQVAEGEVHHLKFWPDGRAIATAFGDTIKLWDATTDQTSLTFRPSTHENVRVISPSGQSFGFAGLSDFVPNVKPQISSDGNIAVAARQTTIVRKLRTGREIFRTDFEVADWNRVRISGNGALLAILSKDAGNNSPEHETVRTIVRLFRTSDGSESVPLVLPGEILDLRFSSAAPELAILQKRGDNSQQLQFWALHEPYSQRLFVPAVRQDLLAYGAAGVLVAAGSSTGEDPVQVWDARNGRTVFSARAEAQKATSLAVGGPRDQLLALGTDQGVLSVWNVGSRKALFTVRAHSTAVTSVGLSPDGRRVISGASSGEIRVWSTSTGRELLLLRGHDAPVESLTFAPGNTHMISASTDGVVKVWEADSYDAPPATRDVESRYAAFLQRAPGWHLREAEGSAASFHLDSIEVGGITERAFLLRLGEAQANAAQWSKALATFSRAADLGPIPPWAYFNQALLAVHLDDKLAFRKACLSLLNPADASPTEIARLTVRACVLDSRKDAIKDPHSSEIIDRVISLARRLPPPTDWMRSSLGPAFFRSGAPAESLAMLNREKHTKGWEAYRGIFLALALHATGKEREARTEAALVEKEIEASRGYYWADRLEIEVLLKEFRRVAP